MRTHAYFVSPQDFNNYWGIDLNVVLPETGSELDSNKADMFLMRVEDRLMAWLDANTYRTYLWESIEGNDKEAMQKAIIIQAMYIFRNSDLSTDSGYDPQRGVVIAKKDLQSIEICDAAVDILKASGLYSRTIKNRRRYIRLNG